MTNVDNFVLGDYNATCYECGEQYKASRLRKHWRGYMVCNSCWEPRHPQDLVRAPKPEQQPAWAQPPSEEVFVTSGVPTFDPYDPTA